MAARSRSVTAQPTENSQLTALLAQAADVGQERLGAAGAVRADQDRVPCRCASGICASAASRTVMWSAAVFAPALPGRSSRGQELPGVVAERQHRVVAEVCLNVGAACSFSEWQTTIEASTSITSPGSSRPAARAGGNGCPVTSARCAHDHLPRRRPRRGDRGQLRGRRAGPAAASTSSPTPPARTAPA